MHPALNNLPTSIRFLSRPYLQEVIMTQTVLPTGASAAAGVRRSLHIAVDKYRHAGPFLPNLRGCENDARAMRQLLASRFGFQDRHATLLVNEQATRQAILDAWRTLIAQTGADDTVFIQYSGHGSQMRDVHGDEEDGMDETILPHDTRDPGRQVFDINDDEIMVLVNDLAAKTDNIVILFDCCHSASATKSVGESVEMVRRVLPDPRDPPLPTSGARSVGPVSHGPSGWLPVNDRLVFMAGCRDDEEANEYRALDGARFGALTFFLMQALQAAAADASFRDVFESAAADVAARYKQHPQIEGALDRMLFSRQFVGQEPFFHVARVDAAGRLVEIGAGAAHGLHIGSQFAIFPPRTRRFDRPERRLATAVVVAAGGSTSQLRLPDDCDPTLIPNRARCVETLRNSGDQSLRVRATIAAEAASLLPALEIELNQSGLLRLTAEDDGADVQVTADAQNVHLLFPDGRPLMRPLARQQAGLAQEIRRRLEATARFQNALQIENPTSGLADALQIEVERLATPQANTGEPLMPRQGGDLVLDEGEPFLLRFTNKGASPIHVTLLAFSADWQISKLYPGRDNEFPPLLPGRSHTLNFPQGATVTPLPYAANASTDVFKFFVTTQPVDFSVLTQAAQRGAAPAGLDAQAPLARLLWQAGAQAARAAPQTSSRGSPDDWATGTLRLTVQRDVPAGLPATSLAPGFDRTSLNGTDVIVRKSPTLGATVNPGHWSLEHPEDTLQPPNALAAVRGITPYQLPMPLGAGRRSAGAEADVSYLDISSQTGDISPDSLLSLELPTDEDAQGFVAVATDGEAYYPVGYVGASLPAGSTIEGVAGAPLGTRTITQPMQTLQMDWLPPGPTTRGLGRTVRLYLYKISGQQIPDIGLRHARLTPGGEVEYTPVRDGDLEGVTQAALFVHGFTSDTRWMVHGPAQWLLSEGVDYRVLTFDYETFNTSVADNAQALYQALVKAGFRTEDGRELHVYAHSLGSLVSRTMIEKWGGAAFVDRLTMAGPPNAGTPLAKYGKQAITWLGSVLLNSAAPTVPALIGSWFLKQALQQAVSTNDMEPDSPLLSEINGQPHPEHVRYLVLAGRNEQRPVSPQATWQSIAQKTLGSVVDFGLDILFQGQHDLAVGVKSARGVRQVDPAQQQVVEMACNHFGYYGSPDGQEAILRWLSA